MWVLAEVCTYVYLLRAFRAADPVGLPYAEKDVAAPGVCCMLTSAQGIVGNFRPGYRVSPWSPPRRLRFLLQVA